jgi:hypothetical protein
MADGLRASEFFAAEGRLTRTSYLLRLLFECLKDMEDRAGEIVTVRLKRAADEIAEPRSDHWQRWDGNLPGRQQYDHIGFVPRDNRSLWPNDLLVHFGWSVGPLLRCTPWLGIYARKDGAISRLELRDGLRTFFEHPVEKDGDDYPIWEDFSDWPRVNPERIDAGEMPSLASILRGDGDELVRLISTRLSGLLDTLDRLADGRQPEDRSLARISRPGDSDQEAG